MGSSESMLNLWVKPVATQNWTIKNWFNWFKRRIKFSYQRITRGWADCDIWDLDCTIAEYLSGTIRHLAETSGHPAEYSYEEWRNILYEISDKIGAYNASLDSDQRYYDEVFVPYITKGLEPPRELIKEITQMEIQEKQNQFQSLCEGLDLMLKYYSHLWD